VAELLVSEFEMVSAAFRQSPFWIVVATIFGILVVGALFSWTAHGQRRGLQIAAHRGGAGAPENTLAAARQAIADGFDWIEIDVQESRDGEVLVVHDDDLQRVGRSPLVIRATDAGELQKIDVGSWVSPKFKDERVPTLVRMLEVCKGKIGVLIELKHPDPNGRLEEGVANVVREHGMDDQVMAMSFDADSVRKLKALRPNWKVGWLTKEAVYDPRKVDADFLGIVPEHASQQIIKNAHHRRMLVVVWTVNDPAVAVTLANRGVDMIVTDNPVLIRRALKDRPAATR
jgi:glycerophosphoryl diester phosphodiesterase